MHHEEATEIVTALMVGCTIHFSNRPIDPGEFVEVKIDGVLWRDTHGRFRVHTDQNLPGSWTTAAGNLEILDDAALFSFLTSLLVQPSLSIGVGDSSDTRLFRGDEGWLPGSVSDLEQALLRIELHSAASMWIYSRPDVWRLLIVDKPLGSLRSRLRRWNVGVRLPCFYPGLTSNPVPPPEQLALLLATVDRLAAAASQPVDRFIARLVRSRIRQISEQVVYIDAEHRFYIEDLEPTPGELAEWKAIAPPTPKYARLAS
jgi:hypothetical protein